MLSREPPAPCIGAGCFAPAPWVHPLHSRLLHKAHACFPTGGGPWPRAPPRASVLQPGDKTGLRLYIPCTLHTRSSPVIGALDFIIDGLSFIYLSYVSMTWTVRIPIAWGGDELAIHRAADCRGLTDGYLCLLARRESVSTLEV